MDRDVYDVESSMSSKSIWAKFTIEHNLLSYTDEKQMEDHATEVHLLAQLLAAGVVTRVR